ncbi:hypothetical protein DWY73_15035 [Bacteroides fragilis]|uniref:Transmembrane protein n=3 Tax=Bacteroides fragilis TaxID=817 RepID=A0A642EGS4_BACFG|nr:hypothetical protein HMPREF0101_03635 [Bacteroides fragilis]BAD50411.1 hypothetical protein BF3668 [Bacteroides fragilis YCH46]KAA4702819.1 hypothetical protein F3B28_00975 [Bacteroides fragilis]KAA4704034.1 hypothetical protein F3B26_06965 [Bacteroides fragilis]KAA4710208.1 hypothetical protein F3B27_01210 [Bacteroides fragilis]
MFNTTPSFGFFCSFRLISFFITNAKLVVLIWIFLYIRVYCLFYIDVSLRQTNR